MSLYRKQIDEGKIYALMPKFKSLLEKTKIQIVNMLSVCENPFISMSWGKDSLVMGHIILSIKNDIPLVHWTSEQAKFISNFDDVANTFKNNFPQAEYRVLDFDLICKLKDFGRDYALENGYDGIFIGMCKDESKTRRMSLSKDINGIFEYKEGIKRLCPMADWRVDDIIAYIAMHDLRVLNLYERHGLNIRTTSRIKQTGHSLKGLDHLSSTEQQEVTKNWAKS